jgi:hypothetical protein
MNKYEKWYNQITMRGVERVKTPGMETHHIVPKCLGGTDDKSNLANVTFREHFICHWLLTKIHYGKERHQLLKALWMMKADRHTQRYKTKITSRVYATLKEEYASMQSMRVSGTGNPMYGREVSEEVRKGRSERAKANNPAQRPGIGELISKSKLGIKREEFDIEWKENLSKNHKSKQAGFDGALSESTKRLIGDKLKGRKQTDEEKEARRRALLKLNLKREKKLCPYCNKEVAVNGYARWHGDNCKSKGETK